MEINIIKIEVLHTLSIKMALTTLPNELLDSLAKSLNNHEDLVHLVSVSKSIYNAFGQEQLTKMIKDILVVKLPYDKKLDGAAIANIPIYEIYEQRGVISEVAVYNGKRIGKCRYLTPDGKVVGTRHYGRDGKKTSWSKIYCVECGRLQAASRSFSCNSGVSIGYLKKEKLEIESWSDYDKIRTIIKTSTAKQIPCTHPDCDSVLPHPIELYHNNN